MKIEGLKMKQLSTYLSLDEDVDSDVVVVTDISVFLARSTFELLLPYTAAAAASADLVDLRGPFQEEEAIPEVPRGVVLVGIVWVPDLLGGHLHHSDGRRRTK